MTFRPWQIVAATLGCLLFGVFGVYVLALVLLLVMPEPVALRDQAWRRFGVWTLLVSGLGGLVGGVGGLWIGLDHPATAPFAFVEGAVIVGAPSLLLGLLVGGAVALAHVHGARRGARLPA